MTETGPIEAILERRAEKKQEKIGEQLVERLENEGSSEPSEPSKLQQWKRRQFYKPDGTPRRTLLAEATRWARSRNSWPTGMGGLLALFGSLNGVLQSAGLWKFVWLFGLMISIILLYHGLKRESPSYDVLYPIGRV